MVDGVCKDEEAHNNQEEGRTMGDPGQTGMTKKKAQEMSSMPLGP
jgi:hypothetical protein